MDAEVSFCASLRSLLALTHVNTGAVAFYVEAAVMGRATQRRVPGQAQPLNCFWDTMEGVQRLGADC